MPVVGQAVPHRDAGQLGEGGDLGLGVAAVLQTVEHAAEHASGVGDGLLVADLGSGRVEVGDVSALVVRADLEGAAGAGGGLLEDEGDVPARQTLGFTTGPLVRLELGGQLDEGHPLIGAEVELAQETTALEFRQDGGVGGGKSEGGHAGPFSARWVGYGEGNGGSCGMANALLYRHMLRPRWLECCSSRRGRSTAEPTPPSTMTRLRKGGGGQVRTS